MIALALGFIIGALIVAAAITAGTVALAAIDQFCEGIARAFRRTR